MPGRQFADASEALIDVAVPPGTPLEAQVAVRRLVELTGILARRCAQLQHALNSRIMIEQAKGMIAERFSIEPDRAFELLRRAARSNRIRIQDLAFKVVNSDETPAELSAQLNGHSVKNRPR